MHWLELLSVLFFALGMAGYPCCCNVSGCGCATLPATVTVTISGVTDGAGCSDCDTIINGTFVVDIDPDTCTGLLTQVGPDCFDYGFDPDNFWILVTITDLGDPSFSFNVKITDGDAPESFHETAEIAGSDCCAVDEDIAQYFSPVPDCDWSVATVHITANC